MFNPFLSNDQQAVVVFWVWKTLAYWIRLLLALGVAAMRRRVTEAL